MLKLFYRTERVGILQTHYMKPALTCYQNQTHTRKQQNCRLICLMDIDIQNPQQYTRKLNLIAYEKDNTPQSNWFGFKDG